jgi:hypothetical protein
MWCSADHQIACCLAGEGWDRRVYVDRHRERPAKADLQRASIIHRRLGKFRRKTLGLAILPASCM